MAVAKNKTRIIFTLPKKQAEWIEKVAKQTGISKSKMLRWLIEKNVENLYSWMLEKEWNRFVAAAIKTPWIKKPEDYED